MIICEPWWFWSCI